MIDGIRYALALINFSRANVVRIPVAFLIVYRLGLYFEHGRNSTGAAMPSSVTPAPRGESGRWTHPRIQEISRRQNASNFDSNNVRVIIFSTIVLIVSLYAPNLVRSLLPTAWQRAASLYSRYAILGVQLLCLGAITLALTPLTRKPDACEDIPLTPTQRKLIGLPPMSRPATPQEQEQYVTPPRFSRSATPRSATSSLRGEPSNSPLSGRGTPLDGSMSDSPFQSGLQRQGSGSHSPFSSALRGGGERRRLSYQSTRSSPLSISEFDAAGNVSTPTKSKTTLPLNNKWLYEKGRASPRGSPGRISPFT